MSRHNPLQVTISSLGIYMGLGGIEHGIGEMLQGRQPPTGLIFPSWPEVNFFRIVAGEPAMSIIPDLFLSGLFAILSSLCFIIWSARCTRVKNGGVFLVLLATAMLLSGGGIFPPIIGIFLGILVSTSSLICNKKSTTFRQGCRNNLGFVAGLIFHLPGILLPAPSRPVDSRYAFRHKRPLHTCHSFTHSSRHINTGFYLYTAASQFLST